MKKLDYEKYLDKVYGGWFGKCLGGAAGAPVEGIKGVVNTTMREIMNPNLPNDDLDIQLLWLDLLEKKGPYLTSDDLAKAWYDHCWYPFGEYGYFLKNFERGILPPLSGSYNNQYFYEGMGCPIRSEIWAFINPGRPDKAVVMAKNDACLDHVGNSLWAEVFLAALESMAFFESDIQILVKNALQYVEEDCKFKSCINMIMQEYNNNASIDTIIRKIQIDYSHPDFTNSVQNMGYTILALLFGNNDMETVINIALKCGYDADCTCATAGAVIGIINGYDSIPCDLSNLLQDKFVCGIDVQRPDDKIFTLAKDTCLVGLGFALVFNDIDIEIDTAKLSLDIPKWENEISPIEIQIDYSVRPSIGFDDSCKLVVSIKNNRESKISGYLNVENLPDNWQALYENKELEIRGLASICVPLEIKTLESLKKLEQKNILTAVFSVSGEEVKAKKDFGVAGGIEWKVIGPFIEPREFETDDSIPPCHGGESSLPTVETMFSNMALPDKEYIDESKLLLNPISLPVERVITAYEDLIPIDENFGIYGEATFYLYTDIHFDTARKNWVVIGNSDAYKIWINNDLIQKVDEARVWQPQSHACIVNFNKGINRIVLKLTRRSESLKFSIGLRGNELKHYHSQKWITDFSCIR